MTAILAAMRATTAWAVVCKRGRLHNPRGAQRKPISYGAISVYSPEGAARDAATGLNDFDMPCGPHRVVRVRVAPVKARKR